MPSSWRSEEPALAEDFDEHASDAASLRPFRWLTIAIVALPLAVFCAGAVISYVGAFDDARKRMVAVLQVVLEHAEKVFESQALVLDQAEAIVTGLSDADVRAQRTAIDGRLARLRMRLAQIDDVRIIGADGSLLAASRPDANAWPDDRDQKILVKLRDGEVAPGESYVTNVGTRPDQREPAFFVGRQRRGGDPDIGGFSGIVLAAISPAYFRDFYAEVARTVPSTLALFKDSGERLARYPTGDDRDPRVLTFLDFRRAVAIAPESGTYDSDRSIDGRGRIVAYHKLAGLPLYVGAGIERDEIIGRWAIGMTPYLLLGAIATSVLVLLTRTAQRRMLGEKRALAQLREETARREETEAQLRQSQKMDAIGRLTGGIAHDFNNLLTIIAGSLDLLERRIGTDDPRLTGLLRNARDGASRAALLTQQLLAFARRQPLAPKPTDIDDLVDNLSTLLQRTLGESIAIETQLDGGAWRALVDPPQLENALVNLAVNARDAMPDGGRLVIATGRARVQETDAVTAGGAAPGDYVTIAVSDTGVGIAPELLDKVVEPFFTTKTVGKGTGLGLSQVFGFVRQSGGAVVIDSTPDTGTSVKLYLPRENRVAPADTDAVQPVVATPAAADVKILLVEDDADVRDVTADALDDLGYRVVIAEDGARGLDMLASHDDVQLLLTDVVMPVMDGRRLAEIARQRRPGLPVVFITGYTPDEIARGGIIDANAHLLTKPFSLRQLSDKIAVALAENARQAGEASRTSSML